MNNRPWYKWFPADFKASPRVQTLTLEQEACFRRLLDVQWLSPDCLLPDDMHMLCKWTANALKKKKNLDAVLQFFPVVKEGFRANNRMLELYFDHKSKSESKKRAAEIRWNYQQNTKNTDAYALQNTMQNDAIPDSDSDLKKKYNAEGASATDISEWPLKKYPCLSRAYKSFWQDIQREHKYVKYPERTNQAGVEKHHKAAEKISQVIRIDGFSEEQFLEIWRWMFDSDDQQAVFWRQQCQSLAHLRNKKTGDTLNKFQKIAADFDRACKKSKQSFNNVEYTA